MLTSELPYLRKLALAVELKQIDQAVLDRQTPEWLHDLAVMVDGVNQRSAGPQSWVESPQSPTSRRRPPMPPDDDDDDDEED